jgi:DNA-directed RNA polymerase subunit RPC12/RpoP
MLKIVGTLAIFGGLAFSGLGAIFIIAGGSDNLLVGGILVGIGLLLFLAVYMMVRAEARRPTHVTQNIQMSGAGEFREKAIQCPGCGGNVADKDIKLIDGGLMLSCPYCGKVSALEEQPKW